MTPAQTRRARQRAAAAEGKRRAAAPLCACGHLHSADSDGSSGPCKDGDCNCATWREAA